MLLFLLLLAASAHAAMLPKSKVISQYWAGQSPLSLSSPAHSFRPSTTPNTQRKRLTLSHTAYATGEQPPSAFPWSTADIANYFVVITTNTAASLEVPFPQTTSDIFAFVQQAKNNKVKPVVSLGGWTGGKYFSSLVATQQSRTSFVSKIQSFVNTYGFEGVECVYFHHPSQSRH